MQVIATQAIVCKESQECACLQGQAAWAQVVNGVEKGKSYLLARNSSLWACVSRAFSCWALRRAVSSSLAFTCWAFSSRATCQSHGILVWRVVGTKIIGKMFTHLVREIASIRNGVVKLLSFGGSKQELGDPTSWHAHDVDAPVQK